MRFGLLLLGAARLAAADHPTVLLLHQGEEVRPVVAVEGTDPIVEVAGKRKRVGDNRPLTAERAPYFAEGFVELSGVSLAGLQIVQVATSDAVGANLPRSAQPNTNFFAADLKPSSEVRGGFIMVISFDPAFLAGKTTQPAAQIVVHELPRLPAGLKTHVEFVNAGTTGRQYIVQVFANGGAELKTNAAPEVAKYFSRVERVRLAAAIAKYRDANREQDHGAVPVVQVRPTLPAGLSAPAQAVTATVRVGEDGLVGDVAVAGAEDPRLEASIRDVMSDWLFLPRLKAGVPVTARVAIPLKFAPTGEKR